MKEIIHKPKKQSESLCNNLENFSATEHSCACISQNSQQD